MKLSALLSFLVVSSSFEVAVAQNAYFKLGRESFVEGDFRSAVMQLEKSCIIDSTNANAQWMLGYAYYHNENYRKSVVAYTRAIDLKPADASAYYYRARAKGYLAKDISATAADKEKYLLGAIVDFSKSIEIEPDAKSYQNRAIAYRDYGLFRLQPDTRFYDRVRGINSLKASIADFEKVLNDQPGRSCKEKLASVVGHH
jgi:tetratricopeptide (TPR) repeat protein